MTARNIEVLHSIVQSYIETGEPVASRTISRQRRDGLSAASIRNVMADLYEEGYLSQPHTSAGRIPTEKAFRSYVQSLARGRVLVNELHRLRAELHRMDTVEGRVERSSHMLTEMTRSIGIAAARSASPASRRHMTRSTSRAVTMPSRPRASWRPTAPRSRSTRSSRSPSSRSSPRGPAR